MFVDSALIQIFVHFETYVKVVQWYKFTDIWEYMLSC